MKILVVGGIGYIGSHMLKRFKETNYEIEILDNLSSGQKKIPKIINFMFAIYQIKKRFIKFCLRKIMIL